MDAPLATVFSRGGEGACSIVQLSGVTSSTLAARGRKRIVLSNGASVNCAKFRGLSNVTSLSFKFPCGRTPGACVHGLALTPSIRTCRLLHGNRDLSLA